MSSRELLKEKATKILNTTDISINKSVMDVVMASFISINKDNYFITNTGDMYQIGKVSDSYNLIKGFLSVNNGVEFFELKELETIIKVVCPIINYSEFEERRDLLANEVRWERNEDLSKITLVHNGLAKKSMGEINYNDIDEFIEEYKTHFPYLDEVIECIVMGRLSVSKSSFISINAPSDWGKSFFIGALEMSSLGTEIQDHQRFIDNTGSSSTPANAIINSLCLCFDEFEYFTDKMKNITSHVQVAEKYKMAKKLELGIKLLFNANMSASFVGAIDDQITNRVNSIVIDKNCTPLTKKKKFIKFGDSYSVKILAKYIHTEATKHINELKKHSDPSKYAFCKLKEFNDKYSLRNNDGNTNVLDEIQDILLEQCSIDIRDYNNDVVFETEDGYFITKAKKTYKEIMSKSLEDSEVKHKMGLFNAFISDEKRCISFMAKPKKVANRARKGMLVKFTQKFVQEHL